MTRRAALFTLCLFFLLAAVPAIAQQTAPGTSDQPALAAEALRQTLFDVQIALMSGQPALPDLLDNITTETDALAAALTTAQASQAAIVLTGHAADLTAAARAGSVAAFAALRAQMWTAVLAGSTEAALTAIGTGDLSTLAAWLPLREFRTSTRFSRPDADGSLAVAALNRGAIEREAAFRIVQTDLYDTYQGQLATALTDADTAHASNFGLRRAEETGLAAGYFAILAPAYADQRGTAAAAAARTAFADLLAAGQTGDGAAFVAARAAVAAALDGFRAAPLTDDQLARRAGQVMRFTPLIAVEYGRGVRDGVVTNPIEIQEALTFHAGAWAAFTDLRPTLAVLDADATARAADYLAGILESIRATRPPTDLQAQVDGLNAIWAVLIPAEWVSIGGSSDIDVIQSILDQIVPAVSIGDYTAAESARLDAYATLELGVEQRLRGFAPDLAFRIESLFWQGTNEQPGLSTLLTTGGSLVDVRATLAALSTTLADAGLVLGGQGDPAAVAINASIIVFREGLEAVLILASLVASLRTLEQRKYRRPLLIGAGLALLATAITWWVATSLLSILLPFGERLEAIVSLIAIGVLLVITNWFFHKTYWTGWMANFHTRKQRLIGGVVAVSIGQTVGLMLLGFTSIYREGFETVLFLQSLVLEAGTNVVLQGVALGLLGTSIVGVITFALQVRLPYKKMLIVTGVFIGLVLLTMVGNTVHVMQAVGWLPITPIPGVFVPYWMGQWFGVFATWQGVILQAAAALFVIGSYFLAEHQTRRTRQAGAARAAASQTG